jgi:GGDEF domain-containing protein
MTAIIETESFIGNRDIVDLASACLAAETVDEIVAAAAKKILSLTNAETIAVLVQNGYGGYACHRVCKGQVEPEHDQVIREQISHLLTDTHGPNGDHGPCEMSAIKPLDAEVSVASPRALWSVDLGSLEAPSGLLTLFGHDRDGIDASTLTALRSIAIIIGESIERLLKKPMAEKLSEHQPRDARIIHFGIRHLAAIQEVFGYSQVEELKNEIIQRIVDTVPESSVIARIGSSGIAVIIDDPKIDARVLSAQCASACRSLEVAEKILVSLRIDISPLNAIKKTDPAPLRVSVPSPTDERHHRQRSI